jgi:hypothetical protein
MKLIYNKIHMYKLKFTREEWNNDVVNFPAEDDYQAIKKCREWLESRGLDVDYIISLEKIENNSIKIIL